MTLPAEHAVAVASPEADGLQTFALMFRLEYSDDVQLIHYQAAEQHPNPEQVLIRYFGDGPALRGQQIFIEGHQAVVLKGRGLDTALGLEDTSVQSANKVAHGPR